jgi:membrane protease YdiL (CAAX protease family)
MIAAILMGVLSSEGFALWRVIAGLRRRGKTLADLGFRLSAPMSSYVASVVIAAIYCAAAIWAAPAIAVPAFHLSLLKLLAIATALMAGFFEEIFFRGYIMTALRNAGHGAVTQIVASSAGFGAVHIVWGMPSGHFLAPMAWTTLLGLALGRDLSAERLQPGSRHPEPRSGRCSD